MKHPFRTIAAALAAVALVAATAPAATATQATAKKNKVTIGVAPAANGLVMAEQPTQIAVGGTPSAKVSVKYAGKWRALGTATPAQPAPVTFFDTGRLKVKVKPKKGKAKVFTVPVYGRFSTGTSFEPRAYGDTILRSERSVRGEAIETAETSDGCAFVDVGVENYWDTNPIRATVMSTGAVPATFTADKGESTAMTNIPVSGDTVITAKGSAPYLETGAIGVVWTCLSNPN